MWEIAPTSPPTPAPTAPRSPPTPPPTTCVVYYRSEEGFAPPLPPHPPPTPLTPCVLCYRSEGELAPRAPPPGVSTDLQPPGMHLYLPHILGHPDALNLALKMSRGRHAGGCHMPGCPLTRQVGVTCQDVPSQGRWVSHVRVSPHKAGGCHMPGCPLTRQVGVTCQDVPSQDRWVSHARVSSDTHLPCEGTP